jgi:peptidoglycan-associated lipoprotein
MMQFMKHLLLGATFLAVAILTAACGTTKSAQKKSDANQTADGTSANGSTTPTNTPPPTEVTEASLRTDTGAGDFALRDDLKPVPFDYDSAKLSDDALATLKANASVLKSNPDLIVRVAGHCDERGTVPYNLALGQKRANQVRDYYIQLGVEKNRIATISFGKEQPLCAESNEDCWAKNRRAETAARAKAAPAATPTAP